MEDVLPLPESPYGVAKHCAEQYVLLYNRLHGTSHAVLRFANVYGPRQDPAGLAGVVAIFCAQALAGERPVIYGDGRRLATTSTSATPSGRSWPPPTAAVRAPGTSAPAPRSACWT